MLQELLEELGHETFTSICYQAPGGTFESMVMASKNAQAAVDAVKNGRNVWYGVNEVAGPARVGDGRGKAADITRLAALWIDLDIKTGGCPSRDVADQIIQTLSELLGVVPVAIVNSGHGLQPLWAIDNTDDCMIFDEHEGRDFAISGLKRWARLVRLIAGSLGASVDSVFDLARVLRCPGTVNLKGSPIDTSVEFPGGAPVDWDTLIEVLDAHGIDEAPPAATGETLGYAVDWPRETCGYMLMVLKGWTTDDPDARHPWLVANCTRLTAAARAGCIDRYAFDEAVQILLDRMQFLCRRPGSEREFDPAELSDAMRWASDKVAGFDRHRALEDVGRHEHPLERERRLQLVVNNPPVDGATALDVDDGPVSDLDSLRPATHTDDGNAELFIGQHAGHLRYVTARGKWLERQEHLWRFEPDDGPAIQAAAETIRRIPQDMKMDADHRRKSLSFRAMQACVSRAAKDPRMRVHVDDLDADPCALNTPSGVVDLRTGELSGSGLIHTKITGAAYNPAARAPHWQGFLRDILGDAEDLQTYVRRLVGYSATGLTTHHVLPFLYGLGGNGKSVFASVIGEVLGTYSGVADGRFLTSARSEHPTEIARLMGRRFVMCSEVNHGVKFDEAKIKLLTGGDRLEARFMGRDFFSFAPTHHLWLMANDQPEVESGGEGFWRRLRLVPFTRIVPESKRDIHLKEKLLQEEAEGILAWIVRGAVEVIAEGLDVPSAVAMATEQYRREQDVFGQFVEECIRLNPEARTETMIIRRMYSIWCRETGAEELTQQVFGRLLTARYPVSRWRSNGHRFYIGIESGTRPSNLDF